MNLLLRQSLAKMQKQKAGPFLGFVYTNTFLVDRGYSVG